MLNIIHRKQISFNNINCVKLKSAIFTTKKNKKIWAHEQLTLREWAYRSAFRVCPMIFYNRNYCHKNACAFFCPRFLYPATQKVAGYYVIPSELWVSIRPSVHQRFNFSTFWPIFFKLCIDIGIKEEWYGIASWLISFWNNRDMALEVCQKCFVQCFRAPTLVPFYQTLHRHWYRRGVVWDCKWDNFNQKQQSYGPWFMSKMHFWSIS